MGYTYYDFNKKEKSENINLIFNDWQSSNENIVIYAPHDDDGFLGPGFILNAAREEDADIYIFIFCNGCGGYSNPKQKSKIVEIRKQESIKAYNELNIDQDHIVRFEYPDFSANTRIGWKLINNKNGSLSKAIPKLREIEATRLLIPNGYREHLDHEAVSEMGGYHAPQAGDPILADWGQPTKIKTVLEYSVWGDFSPEDSILNDRSTEIRANVGVKVENKIEQRIRKAIKKFKSQEKIIDDLVTRREERKIDDGYLEVYRKFEARPTLNYNSYVEYINNEF